MSDRNSIKGGSAFYESKDRGEDRTVLARSRAFNVCVAFLSNNAPGVDRSIEGTL